MPHHQAERILITQWARLHITIQILIHCRKWRGDWLTNKEKPSWNITTSWYSLFRWVLNLESYKCLPSTYWMSICIFRINWQKSYNPSPTNPKFGLSAFFMTFCKISLDRTNLTELKPHIWLTVFCKNVHVIEHFKHFRLS